MTKRTLLIGLGCLCTVLAAGRAWADEDDDRDEANDAVETVVAWDDLPAAVQKTILAKAGDHEIVEVEEVRGEDTLYYETDWIEGDEEVEISVAPDGALLSRRVDDPDDEAADDSGAGDARDDDD